MREKILSRKYIFEELSFVLFRATLKRVVFLSLSMSFKPAVLIVSFAMIALVGCTPQGATHEMGPVLNDEDLGKITPETTKEQVIEQYGQPSFRCFTPGNHNICYFHQTKKNDQVSDQRQVEIQFDEQGKVKEIRVYEPTDQVNKNSENNGNSANKT